MKLIHRESGIVLSDHVKPAYRFWSRFKGLMFIKQLARDESLHLKPCRSIHTYFMKFPIDVLYLNKSLTIVGMEKNLHPGAAPKPINGTRSVVELQAGKLEHVPIKIGHTVYFI